MSFHTVVFQLRDGRFRFKNNTSLYTTFTNFSMKYHLMCKVYTDVGGIK